MLTTSLPKTLLKPSAFADFRQDEDVTVTARSSIDTCDLEPGRPNGLHHLPRRLTLLNQLFFQRDATSTTLFIALPPLNPAQLRVHGQDEAIDKACVRPSIDAFEGEPGHSPDLHLLHLHPTLLNPHWLDDSQTR